MIVLWDLKNACGCVCVDFIHPFDPHLSAQTPGDFGVNFQFEISSVLLPCPTIVFMGNLTYHITYQQFTFRFECCILNNNRIILGSVWGLTYRRLRWNNVSLWVCLWNMFELRYNPVVPIQLHSKFGHMHLCGIQYICYKHILASVILRGY